MYKIKTSTLNKVIDVFQKLQDLGITQESLQNRINTKDVFVLSTDDSHTQLEKTLAFAVLNNNTRALRIDLSRYSSSLDAIEGYEALVGALMLKKEELYVELVGEEKLKKPFGKLIEIDSTENADTFNNTATLEEFDLTLPAKDNSLEVWADKDYVLARLKEDQSNLHLIAPELWKNIGFVKEFVLYFFSVDPFEKIDINHFYTEEFIVALTENPLLFDRMWSKYYEYFYEDNHRSWSRRKNVEDLTPEEQQALTRSQTVKQIMNEKIFSQIEIVEKISTHSVLFNHIKSYLPQEVFKSNKMVDILFHQTERNSYRDDLLDLLPDSFFEKKENVIRYLAHAQPSSHIIENNPRIYKSWINDKQTCLEIVQSVKGVADKFVSLFKPYFQDDAFLQVYQTINPDVWHSLSAKQKKETQYFNHFITYGSTSDFLEEEYFKLIDKDANLIKTYVSRNPRILSSYNVKHSETLKKWRQDEELLALMGSELNYNIEYIPKKTMARLIEREDLLKKVLAQCPRLYTVLSTSMQLKPEFIRLYLEHKDANINNNAIHWLNKDFCLIAFKLDSKYIKNIPQPILKSKEFIYKVLKSVDDGEISANLIKFLPDELNAIFDNYAIKEGYVAFLKTFELNRKLQNKLEQTQAPTKKLKI